MKRNFVFYVFVTFVFALLCWAYSNHFHNPFQFDDDHTIVSNNYIRELKNIPLFFKDARTSSSLPANQAYRPGVTILNAIDFWIGGKPEPDPFYYHISIFISYILLGVLLFFFFRKLFTLTVDHKWNKYFALFAASFFCLHAANAETINYVIARSDSFSTLMLVLAMVVYMYKPSWRSKYIYLLPVITGLFVKETVVMFGPILFIYIILFEQGLSFRQIINVDYRNQLFKAFLAVLPVLVLAVIYFLFSKAMTPPTWKPGGGEWYYYLATQTFVVVHYIDNFFLPLNLSADTDWTLIRSFHDDRVLIGSVVIIVLLFLVFKFSKNQKTRPITFGIAWFFLALLPTSSVFSFSEVLNDHRTFFPYIGLVIASVWTLALVLIRYEEKIKHNLPAKIFTLGTACLILVSHAYGTHRRNKVWNSGESLWYDVTIKSPMNARGLMNYGNSQMAKANYTVALDYYERALKIWPAYSYLYINMGVLKAAMGNQSEAETNFKKALVLNPENPECYYYYANWLKGQAKLKEAKEIIDQGLAISPEHINNKKLRDEIVFLGSALNANTVSLAKNAMKDPSPENYLNLSLMYYKDQQYDKCIDASREALKLRPDYAEAYNNICSAYNIIGNYDEAIKAGKEALRIKPNYELAKNNLNDAVQRKLKLEQMLLLVKQKPTAENYINLSLLYYTNGNYLKCVEAANEALQLKPNSDIAYNNICSAYNVLKMWDQAIAAGEKGIAINPTNVLLKNNLAASKQGKLTKSN